MKKRNAIALGGLALAVLLVISACHSVERASPTVSAGALQAGLRPLDERHAEEFRRAFDEAMDRPRYVVALSPT